jgi:hypothetical protein
MQDGTNETGGFTLRQTSSKLPVPLLQLKEVTKEVKQRESFCCSWFPLPEP